jgi:radical SAM protein with 4Fe4S-binding SPASM domain
MERKDELLGRNLLFWLSRRLNYPLLPPDMVQVNFTFQCNLRCKMCDMHKQMIRMQREGRQTEINTPLLKKIIQDTKELGTKTILFIGGEPFLREDLFELIRHAKGFDLNACLVTNGVLMNESIIHDCLDSGVDCITISIDAASEEIFNKIRGQNVLKAITDNIKKLNQIKEEQKKESPNLVVCCTVMNENLEELIAVADLCKDLKAEKIFFQPVVSCNIDQTRRDEKFSGSIPPERLPALDESITRLIDYKKSSPSRYSLIANSIKMLDLMKDYFRGKLDSQKIPCYAGYNRLQVIQEGEVYFCVNQNRHKSGFGNIEKQSLKELWYSKEAAHYRKLIGACQTPCLQWCSRRDEFVELADYAQKEILFEASKTTIGYGRRK